MTGNLESSRYCVEHAIRRIRELESEVAAFGALNPFTEFVEMDAKTGERVHKVKLSRPIPRTLSGIAVDAINQLRSALDQAGFAVAVAAGTKGKPGRVCTLCTRSGSINGGQLVVHPTNSVLLFLPLCAAE